MASSRTRGVPGFRPPGLALVTTDIRSRNRYGLAAGNNPGVLATNNRRDRQTRTTSAPNKGYEDDGKRNGPTGRTGPGGPSPGAAGRRRRPAGRGHRAGRGAVRGRLHRRRRVTGGRGGPAPDRLHAAVAEELRHHLLRVQRQDHPGRRHPGGDRAAGRHARGDGHPAAGLWHGRAGGVRGHRPDRGRDPSQRELRQLAADAGRDGGGGGRPAHPHPAGQPGRDPESPAHMDDRAVAGRAGRCGSCGCLWPACRA